MYIFITLLSQLPLVGVFGSSVLRVFGSLTDVRVGKWGRQRGCSLRLAAILG